MSQQDARGRKPPAPAAPEEDSWTPEESAALRPDGALTAPLRPPPRTAARGPTGPSFSALEEPLELAEVERAPRAPEPAAPSLYSHLPPPPPERRPSRLLRWLVVTAVLAGSAGAVYAFQDRLRALWTREEARAGQRPGAEAPAPHVIAPSGTAPRGTLMVMSSPSGATVRINGQVVGVTPLALDNTWAGEAALELALPGYQPWKGRFRGGTATHVNATLRRR